MGWRFVRSRPFSARSRRGVSLLVENCRRPGGCCTEWKGRAAQTDRASPGGLGALAPATRGPGLCGISCDRLDFVSITKDPETEGFAWARGPHAPLRVFLLSTRLGTLPFLFPLSQALKAANPLFHQILDNDRPLQHRLG